MQIAQRHVLEWLLYTLYCTVKCIMLLYTLNTIHSIHYTVYTIQSRYSVCCKTVHLYRRGGHTATKTSGITAVMTAFPACAVQSPCSTPSTPFFNSVHTVSTAGSERKLTVSFSTIFYCLLYQRSLVHNIIYSY